MDLDDLTRRLSEVAADEAVQRIVAPTVDWAQDNGTVLSILLALIIGFAIGRYGRDRPSSGSPYQNRGERTLSGAVQAHFGPPDYHLMNHVTLQMKDGTTQVDHILVSRFGVFVIETKDYKGWIFASAEHSQWTQVLFTRRFKFQNPLLQNRRHIRAVEELLDFLPRGAVKSAVVFTGEAEFKTEVPQGVFSVLGLIAHLREHTVEIMSLNRVQFCVGRLETARLTISRRTDVEHVQDLERRYGP